MRKLYTLLSFFFLISFSNAQNPDAFVMTWYVGNPESEFIYVQNPIPFSSNNNYNIDWGDGTTSTNSYHIYQSPGEYTLTITGTFGRINANLSINQENIISIDQWGTNQWETMTHAFANCTNLRINATDSPDLSQCTDLSRMFYNASSMNESINHWDVSSITNMSGMFYRADSFNQPLDNWDVSNVTDMSEMFRSSEDFNQSIDNWDVSNVINMQSMFSGANFFNKPLNNWNVSNVTDISIMFLGAYSFNQPLDNWDVTNVTNMSSTFAYASQFNQSLNNWNVSNVTNMNHMFGNTHQFNQALDNWDVSNVTNMGGMFFRNYYFNQSIGNWDVSNVTNMVNMFGNCYNFNQPLNDWDVSNVTNMSYMFKEATNFNRPLNNWDVSNVTDMNSMFHLTTQFNQDLSTWNFNSDVVLGYNSNNNSGFVSNSGLDIINYDRLLNRFSELELENKQIGAHSLSYCDAEVRNNLIDNLGWTIVGDSMFVNCGDNTISGNIFYDENNNGCDENDNQIHNILVKAYNDSASSITSSNSEGQYLLNIYEGTYNVGLFNLPSYFITNPASAVISFEDSDNNENLDFCITANQTVEDLSIALIPITEARPGFEATYQLVIQNIGTQTVNEILISVNFDNTMQSFISAAPNQSSTTVNQLYFEIASLQPFENTTINFTMQTFTPPTVNGDDVLNFTATVTPNTNDYTPNDNTFELNQIVVNAYDPNDKQVLQGDEILIEQAGDYLHYIIRFQNTGTASAINVRIEDVLHESLNWNTLQMVSSSHDFRAEITENNQLAFIFNNINLPHEAADEEGSNGFVAYKIKPVNGLTVGDFITGNEASIFFDFNLPIITNAVETEIVDQLNINEFNLNNLISIYPNPTNDVLNIKVKDDLIVEEVKLINLQGRELLSIKQNLENINLSGLSSGVYLIKLKTNLGTIQSKIIKN